MAETFLPRRTDRTRSITLLLAAVILVLLAVMVVVANGLLGASNLQYQVTGAELQIRYGLRTHRIPLDQVQRVWVLDRPSGAVRRNGTSTPGTKQGSWSFTETGKITLYATQLDGMTIIETPARKWGVTPADPKAFAQALESRSPGVFAPAGSPSRNLLGMAIPALLVLLTSAITIGTFRLLSQFQRQLRYELGRDGLTIITGWRPIQVAYRDVHSVEVASPKGYPLKLVGAQVGGILWGSFSWKAVGPKLRLYATEAKPLVLIRLKDRTFGITPEDADGFVAAFQQRLRPRR